MKRAFAFVTILISGSSTLLSCGSSSNGSKQSPISVAFVTSTTYNGNLGGTAGADAKCQTRADAAGLSGTFKAWISDSTTDAYCHIHDLTGKKAANCGQTDLPVAAGPWVRTDGTPFAPTIDKLATDLPRAVYTPLIHDEFGHLFPTSTSNLTGTNEYGVYKTNSTCSDWTDGTSAGMAGAGWVYGASVGVWTSGAATNCDFAAPLICMQIGTRDPLPAFTMTGKKVFATSTSQTGNLGGLAGADAICQARAAAGLLENPTKFRAWLSDSTTDAVSRLTGNGPWLRLDGVKVADDKSALTSGLLFTAISVDELGHYANSGIWTGTNPDGTKATDTCSDWSDATSGASGLAGVEYLASSEWTIGVGSRGCDEPSKLYCFEDE